MAWTTASRLTPDEIKGRNMWLVWTGGNDRFWDRMTDEHVRRVRPAEDHLVAPEPEVQPRQPLELSRPGQRALLRAGDRARPRPLRPVARQAPRRLPARPVRERRRNIPASRSARAARTCRSGSYYGEPTGIVGLRLFPNPDFDEAAAKKWDPERYYNDPTTTTAKDLVRPYRVGMSCGFCHVGPSPIASAGRSGNPKWENLSSTVGAQYFWIDRIFAWEADPTQLHVPALPHLAARHAGYLAGLDRLHQQPADDERDLQSRPRAWAWRKRWGKETLAGGELDNKQFNDFVADGPLTEFFETPNTSSRRAC